MKKCIIVLMLGIFLSVPAAWASDPDLEGRITRVDVPKSTVLIKNELDNKIGKREYRVLIKQGMINDYKKNDKLKVWLMKFDNYLTHRIKKMNVHGAAGTKPKIDFSDLNGTKEPGSEETARGDSKVE